MRSDKSIEPIGASKNQLEQLEPMLLSVNKLRQDVQENTEKLEEGLDTVNGTAVKELLQQVVDKLDNGDFNALRESIDDFNETIKSINKATDTSYKELPQVIQVDLSNHTAQTLRLFIRQLKLALESEPLAPHTASDFHKHVQVPAQQLETPLGVSASPQTYTQPKSNLKQGTSSETRTWMTEAKDFLKESELWKATVVDGKSFLSQPFAEITTLLHPFVDLMRRIGGIQIGGKLSADAAPTSTVSTPKPKSSTVNIQSAQPLSDIKVVGDDSLLKEVKANTEELKKIKEVLITRVAPSAETVANVSYETLQQTQAEKAAAAADAYDIPSSEPLQEESEPEAEQVQYVQAEPATHTRKSLLQSLRGSTVLDIGKKLLLIAAVVGGLTAYFTSPKFKEWVDGFLEKLGKVIKDVGWHLLEAAGLLKAPVEVTDSYGNTFSTEAAARRNAGSFGFDDINQYPEWLQRMVNGFTAEDLVDASTGEQVTLDSDLTRLYASRAAKEYYADDANYAIRANMGNPETFTVWGKNFWGRKKETELTRESLEQTAINNLQNLQQTVTVHKGEGWTDHQGIYHADIRKATSEERQQKLDQWSQLSVEQKLDWIDGSFPLSPNLREQLKTQDLSDFESVLRLLSTSVDSMVYQRDETGRYTWDFAWHDWNSTFADQRSDVVQAIPGAVQFNFDNGTSVKRDQLRNYAFQFTNAGLMSFDEPTNPFNSFNNVERGHIDKVIQGMRSGIEPSENDMQVFNILMNRANVNIQQGTSASAEVAASKINEYSTTSYVPFKLGQTNDPHGNPIITKDAHTSGSRTPGVDQGWCLNHVYHALHDAGATEVQPREYAALYLQHLPEVGWVEIEGTDYKVGDVAVNEANTAHPMGHIALWDGSHWVSDFIQNSIDVYGGTGGKIHVFRRPQWSLPQIQIPKFEYRQEQPVEVTPTANALESPEEQVQQNARVQQQSAQPGSNQMVVPASARRQSIKEPVEVVETTKGEGSPAQPVALVEPQSTKEKHEGSTTNINNEGDSHVVNILDSAPAALNFNQA